MMGFQHDEVFLRHLPVITTKECHPKLRIRPPVVLFEKEHVDNQGIVLRHREVDETNVSARVHHPVSGVVISIGGN